MQTIEQKIKTHLNGERCPACKYLHYERCMYQVVKLADGVYQANVWCKCGVRLRAIINTAEHGRGAK